MSLSFDHRFQRVHAFDADAHARLVVGGRPLGWLVPAVRAWCAQRDDLALTVRAEGVFVGVADDGYEALSEILGDVSHALREDGLIRTWRDERTAVRVRWEEAALFEVERGAGEVLGLPGYGTHLNAFVATEGSLDLWVATRSPTKAAFPGELDHVAAGGLPAGISPGDNMRKEAMEEAGIPASLLVGMREVRQISYTCPIAWGVAQHTLFVYDVLLPEAFEPVPMDGEVESFDRWPHARVLASLATQDAPWKFNVPPCILASAIGAEALARSD